MEDCMATCAVRSCGRGAADKSQYCSRCHGMWTSAGSPPGDWNPPAYMLDPRLDPADDVMAWLSGDPGAREAYTAKLAATPKPATDRFGRPRAKTPPPAAPRVERPPPATEPTPDEPVEARGQEWAQAHPEELAAERAKLDRPCLVWWCVQPFKGHGFCENHRVQWHAAGRPERRKWVPPARVIHTHASCRSCGATPVVGRGYCQRCLTTFESLVRDDGSLIEPEKRRA